MQAVCDRPHRGAEQICSRRVVERAAAIGDQFERSRDSTRTGVVGMLDRIGKAEQSLTPLRNRLPGDRHDRAQPGASIFTGFTHGASQSQRDPPT